MVQIDKTCCIDFDGTITKFAYPEMGEPQPGVKEALQELKNSGYRIEILSCRTNCDLKKKPIDRQEQVNLMKVFLDKHKIPYDAVLNKDKPLADWYIDDRAISFKDNWQEVVEKIIRCFRKT